MKTDQCKKYDINKKCFHLKTIFHEDVRSCMDCEHKDETNGEMETMLCMKHFDILDNFVKTHGPCKLECIQ